MKKAIRDMVDECHSKRIKLGKSIVRDTVLYNHTKIGLFLFI